MKTILLSLAGTLLLANPSGLMAQTCTAGQLDVGYGPSGSNGYVQISPVTFPPQGGAAHEDEAFDSGNASYSFAGAAIDGAGNSTAGVLKVKAGGARDLTYGGFGSVAPPSPASGMGFNSLTIDPAGRLVVAILSSDGSTLSFTRYLPTGRLDLAYGTSGTSTITLPMTGQTFSPQGVAAAADGSVVFAITFTNPSLHPSQQPAVLRLTPAGALDTTFGTNG